MSENANPPIKEFRSGGVKAAIWRNDVQRDGQTFVRHSVRIQKSYRDDRGDWKTTEYYYPEDLPRLALVAGKAFEFINLTESEEAPHTADIPV